MLAILGRSNAWRMDSPICTARERSAFEEANMTTKKANSKVMKSA
jgi:hypothetical protein